MSADRIFLNRAARNIQESPAYQPVSKVRVIVGKDENGQTIVFEAGSDSGRVVEVNNPWGTQEIANNMLAALQGYAYKPFRADGAIMDPAAELGDAVSAGDVYSVIADIETTFSTIMSATIGAREDSNLDHEYPYESPREREITRAIAETRTSLTVDIGRIAAEIEVLNDPDPEVEGSIANKISTVEVKVDSISANLEANYLTGSEVATAINTAITVAEGQIESIVSATYQTKTAAQAQLAEAKGYADQRAAAITTAYTSAIKQTAQDITSTVTATIDRYDTSVINVADGKTIYKGYGVLSLSEYPPGSHNGDAYVDQNTGNWWTCNGTKWTRMGTLDTVTDSLESKITQTDDRITSEVRNINTEFSNVYTIIEQTAGSIRAEVNGSSAPEWSVYGSAGSGLYYVGDIVKVSITDSSGTITGASYYQCTASHIASASTEPGSGQYWASYWQATSAPTVQTLINATVDGLTLSYSASDIPNSAYVSLTRGGVALGGTTITMSHVQAETISAYASITAPDVYGGRFMDGNGGAALSFYSYQGAGGYLWYGPTNVIQGSYNAYFQVTGVGSAVTPAAYMYLGGRELGHTLEGSGGFVATGTWDFSGANIILPS